MFNALLLLYFHSIFSTPLTTPVSLPVTLPSAFSQSGSAQFNQKWWLDFADPALNKLIEQALNDNFSLQSSWDRLNQARATLRKSRSSFFPTLNGKVEVTEKFYKSDGATTTSDDLIIGLSAQSKEAGQERLCGL